MKRIKIIIWKAILYSTSREIYFGTPVITGILGSKKREMQVLGADGKQIHNVTYHFHIYITTT